MRFERLLLSSLAIPFAVASAAPSQAAEAAAAAAPNPLPPVFLDEGFRRAVPSHAQAAIEPSNVASPNLELKVYGLDAKDLTISGMGVPGDLINLWSGMTTEPTAATLRDKANYVDLSGRAKIRWTVRTSGFHEVRPVIRLADGTLLVGDHGDSSPTLFNETEFAIAELRWVKLDPERVVTRGGSGKTGTAARWYENPDLTRVDEVGFVDLMPGSGHGQGGYVNVAHIEVYGVPVKR
jgi:hypothetical protein